MNSEIEQEPAMTYTETDPKLVRELAEAAFRNDVNVGSDRDERVEATIIASGIATPALGEKFAAWSKAVGAEYDRLAAAAGSAAASSGHYSRILDFVEHLPTEGDAIAGYTRNGKQYKLTGADLRGLLDDYSAAVQSMVKIENIIAVFDERNV